MMDSDRWQQIKHWFHEALEHSDPASRELLLSRIEDSEVRSQVIALLAGEEGPSLLDHSGFVLHPEESHPQHSVQPGACLGPYQIEESIGSGGMGEVFRATDTRLHRKVAIKICRVGFSSSFRREATAIAALNHPNICILHDVGPDYLVMELVEGQTLADRLRRGSVSIDEAQQIAVQIAEALEAAHEAGIVHRDLKPANIKLTPDGKIKILDFGLAKMQHVGSPRSSQDGTLSAQAATEAGRIVGTACYMSPEQAEGLPVDKRTDIWSFGVVLWEMLTGRRLFDAPTVPRILADVLHREIDFAELPPDIPAFLRTLIRRCLDRNMKTRLRDIGEARIALSHFGAPPSHEDNTKLPRFWVASTALLAVLLVALSLWHFRQKPGQSAAASAARTRFQFQAPMDGPINWLATSPDGRSVVMSTMIGSSAQKLWVRSFDDLQTRFLAQVEQAGAGISLMWSSDNQHIAVTAGGKLYRIPARGGTLTKIADIPKVILGSAWLEENTFLLGSQDGLLRVSLPQGRIERLYDQRSVFPSPLQRGRFLFVRREGLYAGQLDGSPPVRLGSSAEFGAPAHFVPDSGSTTAGRLCFVRDRTLMAQRFDSGTLQFSGQPTPLADLNQVAASSVSETGVLVNGPASVARVLAWFDRSGRLIERVTRPLRTGPSNVVRLSPDGQKALTEILGLDGVRDLWVLDLARRTEFRLSFGGSASGVWSPDGKRILWGKTDGNRYIRNADGSGKDEWLFKETDCPACMIYQWAPDGNSVFAASLVSGPGDPSNPLLVITIVSTTGTQHKPALYSQPPPSRYWAQISPDGKWLAYIEGQPPMKQQIVVESIPAGSGRWQITTEGGEWPMWRSDGKELFYMQDGRMMAIPVKLTAKTVEFGAAKQLFEVLAPLGRYQVSRDGQRFLTEIPADEGPESRMITVDTDWRAGLPNQQK